MTCPRREEHGFAGAMDSAATRCVKVFVMWKAEDGKGHARWINDVQWNYFQGPAKVGKDVEVEREDVPAWTRNVAGIIWQEVLEDVEASHVYTKSIMWRSTEFLRHVVSETGRGAITFCKLVQWKTSCGLAPITVKSKTKNNMSGWWCGACGMPYDWRKQNCLLPLQIRDTASDQTVVSAYSALGGDVTT